MMDKTNTEHAEDLSAARNKRKKIVKIFIIFSLVIVVLSALTASLDPEKLVNKWFGKDGGGKKEEEYHFYPVEEDLDILKDAEYLQFDHRVFCNNTLTGEVYSVEENELANLPEYLVFFYYYFDCIIQGNSQKYPSYFSKNYKDDIPESFTMQMVYDIEVSPQNGEDGEDGTYLVNYKIHKNNGTFRQDIGSDAGRALVFTLENEAGDLKITSITSYYAR